MRLIKTVSVIALMLLFVFAGTSYAKGEYTVKELTDRFLPNLNYMERVYKYDLYGEVKDEIVKDKGEIISNKNAVQAVLALGIMEHLADGTFSENKTVSYKEFAKILMKLSMGENETLAKQYEDYGESRPITQAEAAYYLVAAVGYEVYEGKYSGENPRVAIAKSIGLLNGIDFNGSKHITRGELAQMIYNALNTDLVVQVVFGENERYDTIKDRTLLSEKFNAIKVEGTVTAVESVNLYSAAKPQKGEIEIDRVSYRADNIGLTDILGYRVIGFAKYDENNKYSLLSLEIDEKDKTLSLSTLNILSINDNSLTYLNGTAEDKISLSNIDKVVYNGALTDKSVLSNSLLNCEGEIRICASTKTGGYDIAIINAYSNYIVSGVSAIDEKIMLKNGLEFDGNSYIDLGNSSSTTVSIIKNGKTISLSDIMAGNVISVMGNDDNSYINIIVSDKIISGEIAETSDDKVIIDNVSYSVSTSYKKTLQNYKDALNKVEDAPMNVENLPLLNVGVMGNFYISFDNRIVGFKSAGGRYNYGYMTKFGRDTGIDANVQIRVFTTDGEWKTFSLAKKLTLDDESGVKAEDAYEILKTNEADVCYAVIRYDLNSNEEITFLDTARIKKSVPGEVDPEASDPERIKRDFDWSGTFNWSVQSEPMSLTNSRYMLRNSTIIFTVPDDLTDEELYIVSLMPRFTPETSGALSLYSADDFFYVRVAVQNSFGSTGIAEDTFTYLVVTQIGDALDKNGDVTCVIKGLNAVSQSAWEMASFYTTPQMRAQCLALNIGDIICYNSSGKTLREFVVRVKASDIGNDFTTNLGGHPEIMMGTIMAVDVERNLVKVKIGETERACFAHSAGLYYIDKNKAYNVTAADFREGDRVFGFGGYQWLRLLAIRR